MVQDGFCTIRVKDEMSEGEGEKYCSLFVSTPLSSIQDLYASVSNTLKYNSQSFDLFLVKHDGTEQELKQDEESVLKDFDLIGSESENFLKILPRKTPSIVISLASNGADSKEPAERFKRLRPKYNVKSVCHSSSDVNPTNERHDYEESAREVDTMKQRDRFNQENSLLSSNCSKNWDEFNSSYSSYSSLSSGNQCTGYVGLVNQAMTCYLNSLLQALYMTPEFRNALYKWEFVGSAEENRKSIPYQLQRLFLSLQTSKRSAVETSKLTKSFGWDVSDSWQQHDIQELCRVMFDALEQRFEKTDQADFINNLYQGKLIDYVTCLECKTEKTRIDTFLDIPLPVRPFGSTVSYNSVAQAMHAFIQPEILDGNNQYFCETCNKKCDAHKGLKFSHFPYILTLHLKRFDFDYNVMSRIKLTDRVEFPYVLNINGFLSGDAKTCVNGETAATPKNVASGAVPEEACSTVKNQEHNDSFCKGDDMSIADSASTFEDEGCHGTEPSEVLENMQGSTNGSNSSGSNVDMQDDDEGIDLCNGATFQNQQEHERNQRHGEGDGPPGPYIYELFAIMIHSGSASGGHYYVYIKDFDKDEWFCFDDQSVSRITNEDISMTYGGGAHRAYYSGAHSSSTSAYMLMYRQIDRKRNQSVMTVDEFPPHLMELMKGMQEEEEEERINRERDKVRLKFKIYCRMPGEDKRLESKLSLDRDTTLADATNIAHKMFHLDGIFPLEQCRLVAYDSSANTMDCSFDNQDGETIYDLFSTIQNPHAHSFYLEIREADAQFETYRPGGFGIKVYRVHLDSKEVDPPVEVRVQSLTTSLRDIRLQVGKALKLPPGIKLMMEKYGSSPVELDDDVTLQSAGFFTNNKIFVTASSESVPEESLIEEMTKIIDIFGNTITLYCTLPDTDRESLSKLGILPVPMSDEPKTTNGECEAVIDSTSASKGTSRGTSPQLLPLDGEEECIGATGCSDQSTSEDSSLTDSDRTIVGEEGDYWLGELSPASNSPTGSDQPIVSSPISSTKKKEKIATSQKNGECLADDEFWSSEDFYLKIHPYKDQDLKKVVRVQVDKRMLMGTLKAALAQYMGVSADFVKLFRKCGSSELLCSRSQDPLSSLRDEEHIMVRLERALRKGEFRGKVYELLAAEEPVKFLCDWILTKDMRVGEAKKQILDELKNKEDFDVPFNRCRLRFKKWKTPGKILLDSQSFQELQLIPNWELFLQKLSEPEPVTSPHQVTVMLRRFYNYDSSLDDFHEVTLQSASWDELREAIRETSGISLDLLQFARPSGTFPFVQLTNHQAKTELVWGTDCNCNLEDGTVLYYRDKDNDRPADSNERRWVRRDANDGRSKVNSARGNKREKALRIILSPSPSATNENLDSGVNIIS